MDGLRGFEYTLDPPVDKVDTAVDTRCILDCLRMDGPQTGKFAGLRSLAENPQHQTIAGGALEAMYVNALTTGTRGGLQPGLTY